MRPCTHRRLTRLLGQPEPASPPSRWVNLLTTVGRQPAIHHLVDPALWRRTITDQRYLIRA